MTISMDDVLLILPLLFLYQMELGKTRWLCSLNNDQGVQGCGSFGCVGGADLGVVEVQ